MFGIALVWLLFESGLRNDPIARVLNDIAGTKKANANLAAKTLLKSESDYLLIGRKPRGPTKNPQDKPEQRVKAIEQSEIARAIGHDITADLLIIPVGPKFEDICKRMEILY